jgi:HPt (histidine-containing phosphotransfer) domain-containing protein
MPQYDELNCINNKIIIDGLNTEKGLAMAGGKIEKYIKVLSLFYKDGLAKIKEIETCLETNNIQLYTVHVHALKSAAAIIGADRHSDNAKALEMAGKQEDLAFIHINNAGLITDLETLLSNINVYLSKKAEENQKTPIDKELLKQTLSKLKTALNDFNFNETNNAVDLLQKFVQAPDVGDSINIILQDKLITRHLPNINKD